MNMKNSEFSVPVLMYHEVLEDSGSAIDGYRRRFGPYYVTEQAFEEQMQFLEDGGYTTLSLVELLELKGKNSGAGRPVVLTFDDGYAGNYSRAFPILKKHGFTAAFFITANGIGSKHMMNAEQLREMSGAGMSIQSHTLSHPFLRGLDDAAQEKELAGSKILLEELLGSAVDFVSLPNGSYGRSFKKLAMRSGYLGACGSKPGFNTARTDRYQLRRFTVKSNTGLAEYRKLLEDGMYGKLLALKKALRMNARNLIGTKLYGRLYALLFNIQGGQ
jgi:peptidoglycan/xylan/chitin deacetylase (PgdA/CDA1 family)